MTYDLEADWMLLDTCNYRCSYCFSPPEVLSRKLSTFASVEEWRDGFDALGRTWLLHITGGEPTIYPDFAKLCAAITQKNFISINTNLTNRSLMEFVQLVDPSRVHFINAALHIEERDRRDGHAAFLQHLDLLRTNDFPVIVSLVATPAALARFEEALALTRSSGMIVAPKLFRGNLDGRSYPESYTDEERRRFAMFSAEARRAYRPLFERNGEWPTIDMFHDDQFLDGVPDFTGVSCDAGRAFVRIQPNGDVVRCEKDKLGNILRRTFKPRQRPAACDTQFCYYFCKKYTLPDRSWLARKADRLHSSMERLRATSG